MNIGRRNFVASSVLSLIGLSALTEEATAEIGEYIGQDGYVDTEGLRLAIKHHKEDRISESRLQDVINDWERRGANALNPASAISQHTDSLDGQSFDMDIALSKDDREVKSIAYTWDGNAKIEEEGNTNNLTSSHHYTGDVQEFQLSHPEATSSELLIDDTAEKYMDGVSIYDLFLIGANVSFDADIGQANRYTIESHRNFDSLQGEIIVSDFIESFRVEFPSDDGYTNISMETSMNIAQSKITQSTGNGRKGDPLITTQTHDNEEEYVEIVDVTPDPTEPLDLSDRVTFDGIEIEYNTNDKDFNKANLRISENGYGGDDSRLITIDDPDDVPGESGRGEWSFYAWYEGVPDWDRLTLAVSIYEDTEDPAVALDSDSVSYPVGEDTPQGVDLRIEEIETLELGDDTWGIDVAVTNMGRDPAEDVRVDLDGDLSGEFRDSPVDLGSGAYEKVFTSTEVSTGENEATVRVDPYDQITDETTEQDFTITVDGEAQIDIEDVSVDFGSYTTDETVPVEIELDNSGDGTDTFELSVDYGNSDGSREVTLDPDETLTRTVDITADEEGTYDITVTAGEHDTEEVSNAFRVEDPVEISLSVSADQDAYEPGTTARTTLDIQGDSQTVQVEETLEFPDGTEQRKTASVGAPVEHTSRWEIPIDMEPGPCLYDVDVDEQSISNRTVFDVASPSGSKVTVNVQVPVNEGDYGAIDTKVKDVDTGVVTLESESSTSRTISNGSATFADIDPGQYELTIDARNQEITRTVRVENEPIEWDFKLAPSGSASGMLFDSEGEHPLENATVTIPALNASTIADELGRFQFNAPVPRGTYDLAISANGKSVSREYEVDASGFQNIRGVETDHDLELDGFNFDEVESIKSGAIRAVEGAIDRVTAGIHGLVSGLFDFFVDFVNGIKELILNFDEVVQSMIELAELVIDDPTIIVQMIASSIDQFREKQEEANPYDNGVKQSSFEVMWYIGYLLPEFLSLASVVAKAIKSVRGFISLAKAFKNADAPEAPGITKVASTTSVNIKQGSTGWHHFVHSVDMHRKRAYAFPPELFVPNSKRRKGAVMEFIHGGQLLNELREELDAPVKLAGSVMPKRPEPNTYYLVQGRDFKINVDGEFDWTIVKTNSKGEPSVERIREVKNHRVADTDEYNTVEGYRKTKIQQARKIKEAVEDGRISPDTEVYGDIPAKAFDDDQIRLQLASRDPLADKIVQYNRDQVDEIQETLWQRQNEMSRVLEDGVQRPEQ